MLNEGLQKVAHMLVALPTMIVCLCRSKRAIGQAAWSDLGLSLLGCSRACRRRMLCSPRGEGRGRKRGSRPPSVRPRRQTKLLAERRHLSATRSCAAALRSAAGPGLSPAAHRLTRMAALLFCISSISDQHAQNTIRSTRSHGSAVLQCCCSSSPSA